MYASTDVTRLEALVSTMSTRMATITRTLGTWVQESPQDLQAIEEHVLRLVKELGAALVAGLCTLLTPAQPARTHPCPCGHRAAYQRQRPATVTTILGPITVARPYYRCATCRRGHHPLDADLDFCAGSRSAGLDELLALLGATQDSFADAAAVLDRLTLVHLSPNTVRDATEELGAVLVAHQTARATQAQAGADLPVPATPDPARLYLTMDGVLAHLHERGWSELKVGACYQTRGGPTAQRPEQIEIRAHSLSYVTALAEAETFGWQLWQEAVRRGVQGADEVVVVGDGAHWIWNLAELHVPQATQILDWYHASEYVWEAATAIWGEQGAARTAWAERQLDALWAGRVAEVLVELEQQRAHGQGVLKALSYDTTHQGRMDYAAYRARGLQIGSGSVESGCKQLVSARLKQAGMIWDAAGAEAVATVRAWLKSERWAEAMAQRPRRQRRAQRPQRGLAPALDRPKVKPSVGPTGAATQETTQLPPDVVAAVRAELARSQTVHPWRRAWSRRQQRQATEASISNPAVVSSP